MKFIMDEEGSFELYDSTYDVVIHCDSEKARDEVLADLKAINDRFNHYERADNGLVGTGELFPGEFESRK